MSRRHVRAVDDKQFMAECRRKGIGPDVYGESPRWRAACGQRTRQIEAEERAERARRDAAASARKRGK